MEYDQSVRIITRYNEPTKMDTANYLTLCEVGCNPDNILGHQFYIQISKDSENPRWEFLGYPGEDSFIKLIELLK